MTWRQSVIKALTLVAEKLAPSGEKDLEKSEKKSEKREDEKVWVEVTTQPEKKGEKYVGFASFHWKKDRDEQRQSQIISLPNPATLKIKSRKLWVKPKGGAGYYYGTEPKKKEPKVEPGKDYEKFKGRKLTLKDIIDEGSSMKEAIGHLMPSKYPMKGVDPADVKIDLTGDVHSKTLAKWPQPTEKNPDKVQYAFTGEALERNAAKKWERVKELEPRFNEAKEKLPSLFQDESRSEKQRDSAAALFLISETGLRPGNESDFKKTGNQGVTTLLADSVKIDGDNIKLKFIGKNNKENTRDFNNPELAAYLKKKMEGKQGSDRIFNATDKDLSKHGLKEIGLDDFKTKDFRTLLACRKAAEELAAQKSAPLPESEKEAKKMLKKVVKETSEKVADYLGNTAAMAKKSYISPAIFDAYVTRLGGDPKMLRASAPESLMLLFAKDEPPTAEEIWKQALEIELPEADEDFKAEDEDDEQLDSVPLPEDLQDMSEDDKAEVAAALRQAIAVLTPPRGRSLVYVNAVGGDMKMLTSASVVKSAFYVSEHDDEWGEAHDLFEQRKIHLHRGYDDFLVVAKDGEVIAAAALAIDWNDRQLEFSVAVAPEHERKGHAQKLIGEVLEYAKYEDMESILADVVNAAAMIPLLRRFGFEKVGHREWGKTLNASVIEASAITRPVYHGTNANFRRFSLRKSTMGIIWFTSDRASIEKGESGAQGKDQILELKVNMDNPAGWDEYDNLGLGQLQQQGFDGAILPKGGGHFDGFVFDPKKVKIVKRHHMKATVIQAASRSADDAAALRQAVAALPPPRGRSLVVLAEPECPPAAVDLELNTKNRNASIKAEHIQYGPLNLADEDYWVRLAEHWNTEPEVAKKSVCANCVAFDISPRMLACMPGKVEDEDGKLGYCWMHHFKCHSARTCYTWAAGGPIKTDETSLDWQAKSPFAQEEEDK